MSISSTPNAIHTPEREVPADVMAKAEAVQERTDFELIDALSVAVTNYCAVLYRGDLTKTGVKFEDAWEGRDIAWADLEQRFEDLREAILAERKASQWQPMDSAPRDGSMVILAWSPEDWVTGQGFWRDGRWVAVGTFYKFGLRHPPFELREAFPEPTYWCSWPTPPVHQPTETMRETT